MENYNTCAIKLNYEISIQQNNEIEEIESVCLYTEETEDKWSQTYFHKFY